MGKSTNKLNKKPNKIYLDYASATPIEPVVLEYMQKVMKENFANAGAIHELGMKSKKILEQSRRDIAKILGAHGDEIVFTSGATESNNLAILGILKKENFIPHIVTTNIEHASVLEVCKYLEKSKRAEVTFVEVEENGVVDPRKIKKAIRPNTVLVSIMYANNEIGTIQSIKEIAKEIRHYNKINLKKIIFHTDATQGMNYLPVNVEKLGIDLLSFNAGKIYGPKGVGVLYVRRNIKLSPTLFGGSQEWGIRPGTENLVNIVGLTEALKFTEKIKEKENKRLASLQKYFFSKVRNLSSEIVINGDEYLRLPNNINITIPKIPSDLLVIELSAAGIMTSAKSACKSGDGKASHVISAIRRWTSDRDVQRLELDGSLRISMGRFTTKKEIDQTVKVLAQILTKLKKWYN